MVLLPPKRPAHTTTPANPHHTVGQQVASLIGAAHPRTMLAVVPYYLGMVCLFFLPTPAGVAPVTVTAIRSKASLSTLVIAAVDLVLNVLAMLAVLFAGSGIALVLQSSSIVWSAIAGSIVFGRHLRTRQWFAIVTVLAGLAMSSMQSAEEGVEAEVAAQEGPRIPANSAGLVAAANGDGGDPLAAAVAAIPDGGASAAAVGAMCALGSALISSAQMVLVEKILGRGGGGKARITPTEMCVMTGAAGVCALAAYSALVTVPEWDELVASQVTVGAPTALAVYALTTLGATSLTYGYFTLLGQGAGIVVGMLLATRAVLLFLLSAPLFCSVMPSQCMGVEKAAAVAVIVGGLVSFAA